jgi:hypothetical protein
MAHASSRITIDAPVGTVWATISHFGTADRYLAGVVSCRVERSGVGAQRTLTNADGSTVIERLEALDETTHTHSYMLLTDTPFRNCLTTMTVRDFGRNQAEVIWAATFQVDGLPSDEAAALMEGAFQDNCLALRLFMETDK